MFARLKNRIELSVKANLAKDALGAMRTRLRRNPWPCYDKKYLVVGCESSGTTPISHLLLRHGAKRFLLEGISNWVWDLYMSVYQGHSRIRDYPQLQSFDRIKVPGFAAILPQFMEEFPNTSVVYVVRDPRDVVVSAYRTKKVTTREQLSSIPWVSETWLGIREQDPVARLALRWRIYLERSQLVPETVYVRYEDFCSDKIAVLQKLASRLDIEFDEDFVVGRCDQQASFADAREYQPKGPGSWKEGSLSERDVELVEEICGDQMRHWNYL